MATIDLHVLTMPHDNPEWASALKSDLDGEPVTQHWMPGALRSIGESRCRGFAAGHQPFVSFADPDDRITSGVFFALTQALATNPHAPFAWAGEQRINRDGYEIGPANVPHTYDPLAHASSARHVHGVMLFRRNLLMPELSAIAELNNLCEWVLTQRMAKHGHPVPVPMVGRLWRHHGRQSSINTTQDERRAAIAAVGMTQKQSKTSQYSRTFDILPKPENFI